MVTEEGKIALLDCGRVAKLDAENKMATVRMFVAFEESDPRRLAEEIMEIGIAQEEVDIQRLTQDLGKILRTFYDTPAKSVNIGQFLTRMLNVSANHKVRLPAIFTVLAKVMTNMEGICRQLDPDFNFTEVARGYVGKSIRSGLSLEHLLPEIYRAAASLRSFIFTLPENLERLMRRAVEGKFRIEFKHQGLEQATDTFRTGANRISLALIVGSTIVGSSLLVVAGRGPVSLFGIPVLGVIGYLVAMIFGIWLVVAILRSGIRK
jgi:ubiquinone biosynthesis protein